MTDAHRTAEKRIRFRLHEKDDSVWIFDDDFHWDAAMPVTGDFASVDDRRRFAQAICDVLNENPLRIPRE